MTALLFVIELPPDTDGNGRERWSKTVGIVEDSRKAMKGCAMLNEGTWEIHAIDGLPLLGLGICQCDKAGLKYRVFSLDEKAELPK